MKKEEYVNTISEKLNLPKKEVNDVVDSYLELLSNKIVENDQVVITNFGSFQKTLIKPKAIYSPIDGSTLNTKSYYRITFTCSKQLIERLKNK
ncbi:MAG: HU family DNA-binding protein [Bacilli bacterium]|nr:HU family DNA-binding protein [Bacilli bacterium]